MSLTKAELVQRARDLAPAIKERAAEAAIRRKPADESIRELADAGILQMFVPKRWGGSEAPLSTMMDTVEIISEACPSTGWIAAFYISHNIYVAKFPEVVQEELYGARGYVTLPAASAPDLQATKVDGGWKISGRAVFGSGVMHADWVLISGATSEGPRSFLLPIEDVEVIDNWHFTGMSGTGSNDYAARDAFVPDAKVLTGGEFHGGVSEGSRIHANPLFSIPFLLSAYCTILPVITGSLKGALGAYEDIFNKRVRNFSGVVVKEQQHAHVRLGELQIATKAGSELARAIYRRVEDVLGSRDFSMEDRIEAKGQTAFVSRHCRETANNIMAAAGASSFHLDQPLQRIWRDINTVCSHAFWDWDVSCEATARSYLGLSPNHPLI